MRGISPKKIPAIVAKQVGLLQREALLVITLKPSGEVDLHENPNGRLGVIAVIGPGVYQGENFDQAPLLEVGFWKSRPYNKAYGFGGRYCNIGRRLKRFSLTPAQYEIVAPIVFQAIQYLVDQRVSGWKGARYKFWFRRQTNHWNSRRRGIMRKQQRLLIPRYITVTFSTKDSLFLPDLYWAEFNSEIIKTYLFNFSRWVRSRIWQYESKKGWKGRTSFEKLKGVRGLKNLLDKRFPPLHLKKEALLHLPGGKEYPLFKDLAKLLRWDGEQTKERELAKKAKGSKARLDGLQLVVHRNDGEHVTCWIYANSPTSQPSEIQEVLDEVPF